MGPEGGAGSGTVVTTSMPKQVAANLAGCTGPRVRPYLSAIVGEKSAFSAYAACADSY